MNKREKTKQKLATRKSSQDKNNNTTMNEKQSDTMTMKNIEPTPSEDISGYTNQPINDMNHRSSIDLTPPKNDFKFMLSKISQETITCDTNKWNDFVGESEDVYPNRNDNMECDNSIDQSYLADNVVNFLNNNKSKDQIDEKSSSEDEGSDHSRIENKMSLSSLKNQNSNDHEDITPNSFLRASPLDLAQTNKLDMIDSSMKLSDIVVQQKDIKNQSKILNKQSSGSDLITPV